MRSVVLSSIVGVSALGLGLPQAMAAQNDSAPATIRVTLPADARLTVDGHATQSTSADRLFESPPLEPGRTYAYTFKAEFVRAGRTITVQQRSYVQAGRETAVSLNIPAGASASGTGSAENRTFAYNPDAPESSQAGTFTANPAFPGPAAPAPQSSAPASPGPATRAPQSSAPASAPRSSPGFGPPSWGTSPSDPFYDRSGQ
jgi:uncharacterized protein (TIGR03000 family)